MSSRIRKFESGNEKRKKKNRIEELTRSQKGALDTYFKTGRVANNDQNVDNDNQNVDNDNQNAECEIGGESGDVHIDIEGENYGNVSANMVDSLDNENNNVEDLDNVQNKYSKVCDMLDIYDPRNWNALDSKMRELLLATGPRRDLSILKGPKDKFCRRFSSTFFTRVLPNGEKCDRDWLVYSKELDKIFCFCCKFFGKGIPRGQLVNEGLSDWHHASVRLREHETSVEHIKSLIEWYEMRVRLKKNQSIDKLAQQLLEKVTNRWKNIVLRIISIVKFLAKHNLAFRGSNEKLHQNNNGNFLGLIDMLAEFDPCVKEHVEHITNDDMRAHYLSPCIQNELILLLASAIKDQIIKKIKQAKYFSIILDCTPDISHQEQMSLIIRYVDVSSNSVTVEESFLGFLNVNDTSGQGLFDVLQNELKLLDLDINDVRGQGYDNGSNMKGKHQGVQKRLLDINRRAFYTPCGNHSLNLALCDMANTCAKAKDFFGIIQRIYTIFANSTKRWAILRDNVKGLTLKSLSCTRWESRVESVKAIRFQISDICEALLQVGEVDNDPKIKSEAKSLAQNELGDFEFLVAIIIWYDMLSVINLVSKHLQSKDMIIDDAIEKLDGLISFFESYRENGFSNALDNAKEIAKEINVDPLFPQRREIRRKRHFDEDPKSISLVAPQSAEESFRTNYFLYIVDQAIVSLKSRFEQYQEYAKIFGFLFTSDKLHSLDDMSLKSCCIYLEDKLRNGERSDVDGNDLFVELKLLVHSLPKKKMGPIDILQFIKHLDCFPNAIIAYRILLTIPVTVASAERSFSKLKLLKSYLRSTMSQERLNGLAMIAIENEVLEKIDTKDLIEDFASKNARRMALFK